MLSQQLHSRLHLSRRQAQSVAGQCPVALRQPVVQRCPVRHQTSAAAPGPPRHRTVANARRGRPVPEEPSAGPNDGDVYGEDDQFDFDEEEEDGEFAEQLDPMSRRLMGMQDDEDEFVDEDEELAMDEEDEGVLDEAAEADRDGAAADDVGEPSTSYPEPPERQFLAADLFGEAAIFDAALWLAANFPTTVINGVQSNPHLVTPGDVYVWHPDLVPEDVLDCVSIAVEQGASVVVAPHMQPEAPGLEPPPDPLKRPGALPEELPLVRVADTEAAGARLAAAFYEAPSRELVTVGVLGLLGKTTTAWLIRGILEELGQTVGLMSSIEHAIAEDRLDEDGYLWEALEEDPSADRESSVPFKLIPYAGKYEQYYGGRLPGLNAQKLLAGMKDRGAGVAVMEVGTQGLVSGTFDYIDLNVAVITHLSPRLGPTSSSSSSPSGSSGSPPADQLAAAAEAADIALQALESKLRDPARQALVVNADDPGCEALVRKLGGTVPVVTYGVANKGADVRAESIKSNIWETEVIVRTPSGRLQIITNLLGKHNVANVLAAVATGVALKAPLASIVAGIEAVEIPGRSEVIDEGQEFSVVVDAARSPETLGAMLDALRQGGARQIFTVFGCCGNEDPSLRPKMGSVAHSKSDYVIVTNSSPRSEDPAKVVSDIVAGFPDDLVNRYSAFAYFPFQDQGHTPLWFEPFLQKAQRDARRYIMEDRYSAIRAAIGTAGPEDVVLLAGKGHEDWVEHLAEDGSVLRGWLDDRVEARNALSKLKYLDSVPLSRDTLPWGTRIETLVEGTQIDAALMGGSLATMGPGEMLGE